MYKWERSSKPYTASHAATVTNSLLPVNKSVKSYEKFYSPLGFRKAKIIFFLFFNFLFWFIIKCLLHNVLLF